MKMNHFKPASTESFLKDCLKLREPDQNRDINFSPLHDGIMQAISKNLKMHCPYVFEQAWTASIFPERATKEILRLVEQQIDLLEKVKG